MFMWLLADWALNYMWRGNLIHLSFGLWRCIWPCYPEEMLIKLSASESWLKALSFLWSFRVAHRLTCADQTEECGTPWYMLLLEIGDFSVVFFLPTHCIIFRMSIKMLKCVTACRFHKKILHICLCTPQLLWSETDSQHPNMLKHHRLSGSGNIYHAWHKEKQHDKLGQR